MQKIKLNIQLFASGSISASSSTMSSGTGKVEWSSSVISGTNKSSVTTIVYARRTSGTGTYCTVKGSVTINGKSNSISKYRGSDDKWTTSWKEVGRYTTEVEHTEDGSKQIAISFSINADTGGLNGTAKGSANVTLDKINRASKLGTIEDFKLTDTITINITKYITAATDKLLIKLGDNLVKEINNITNGYELTFTAAEQTTIKNLMTSPQATLIFLLTTISGGTTLGTSTQSATVTSLDKPIYRNVIKKENGHYQVAINGVVDTTKSDVLQVYDDNGNLVNDNQLLWGPGYYYMTAGHTINLSQKVSEQKNGIVLVWQEYSNGQAQPWGFNFIFIPKWQVVNDPGRGMVSILANSDLSKIATKYCYIYDDHINGNNVNSNGATKRASGITTTNNNWVLTKVIGV